MWLKTSSQIAKYCKFKGLFYRAMRIVLWSHHILYYQAFKKCTFASCGVRCSHFLNKLPFNVLVFKAYCESPTFLALLFSFLLFPQSLLFFFYPSEGNSPCWKLPPRRLFNLPPSVSHMHTYTHIHAHSQEQLWQSASRPN